MTTAVAVAVAAGARVRARVELEPAGNNLPAADLEIAAARVTDAALAVIHCRRVDESERDGSRFAVNQRRDRVGAIAFAAGA